MNWNQVSIETSERACDIVASVLVDAGATGVQIEGGETPVARRDEYLVPAPANDTVKVIAYYGDTSFDATLDYIKQHIAAAKSAADIDFGALLISINEIEDSDWNANFKKHFKTFRAAGDIVVKPTWEKYEAEQNDIIIELDPGMAFGSGVHETTKMCLELVQRDKPSDDDWSVMDIGCGSGILSIACAKLGATEVLALDYDQVSVDVTQANAKANNVKLTAIQSDLLQNAQLKQYDIVLANIIADIVIRLNGDISSYLNDDATYIVSGIIEDRLADVIASLEQNNFIVLQTLCMADWRALAVRKANA